MKPTRQPLFSYEILLDSEETPVQKYRTMIRVAAALSLSGNKFERQLQAGERLGLSIDLGVPPKSEVLRIPFKGIFDEVLTAFHRYSGDDLDEVASRLGQLFSKDQKTVTSEHIATVLESPRNKLNYPHKSVHLRGSGVQLNPRDDLCDFGSLRLNLDPMRSVPTLTIRVFEAHKDEGILIEAE